MLHAGKDKRKRNGMGGVGVVPTYSRRAPLFHVAHSGNQLPPNRQTLYPYAADPNNLAHPRCENTTDQNPNRCCALARPVPLIDEP